LAIYPLRTMLANAFHLLMGLVPVLVLAACRHGLPSPSALFLGMLPGTFLLMVLGWSAAVLVGVANVHFRDTRHITDIAMRAFFYLTPVMYPADLMQGRRLGLLMQANPLTPFLRLIRDVLLSNSLPPASVYAQACLIVALVSGVAVLTLWNEERQLIFHL
jgi:ABC-type polysaccharide/polyol phosphate export permease